MAKVVTTWKEDMPGWAAAMRTAGVTAELKFQAEKFKAIAIGVFQAQSKHEEEPPAFYTSSFVIKRVFRPLDGVDNLPGYAYQVGNTDPIANLVEFGAHPGGDATTRVLRYRVFGRTLDIMELSGGL